MPQRFGKYVEVGPRYIHETFLDFGKLKQKHPGAIIRTLTVDSHQLRIATWGPVIGYRRIWGRRTPIHKFALLQSLLHPREEKAKCGFVAAIRRSGKLKELLMRGAMPLKVRAPNPPPRRGTPPLEITYRRRRRAHLTELNFYCILYM